MRKNTVGSAVIIFVFLTLTTATAQAPLRSSYVELQKQASEAYQHKDYAVARAAFLKIRELTQGSPDATYNLACVSALAGNKDDAFRYLRLYSDMGLVADVANDPDLSSLKDDPRLKEITSAMEQHRKPASLATSEFDVAEPGLLVEDIAYDPRTKAFFFSSVLEHKIVRRNANGKFTDFARQAWPMLALAVDADRHVLWATTTAIPSFVEGADSTVETALLKFDLQSGRLLARYVPPDGGSHSVADMTLARDGTVVVTDSRAGSVYVLRKGSDRLVKVAGDFISPQTPAMMPDGRHALIPDYAVGVAVLDLITGERTWLKRAESITMTGIDGLYLQGNELIAMQNGVRPERVVRFQLGDGQSSVKSVEVLERGTARLGEPTHGVVVGNDLYFIANSGWTEVEGGKVKPDHRLTKAHVLRMKMR